MLKLRDLRKKRGLTMKELGIKFGMAESTISQYETGKRQPDYEMLLKFSDFFGVTVDYILTGGEDGKEPIPVTGDGQVSPAKQALLDMMDDMDENELIALAEMVKAAKKIRMRNTE